MTQFAPPSCPPPPKVPDGWKPIWDDRYSEYFFVNTLTSQSTWDKPTQRAACDDRSSDNNASSDRSLKSNNPFSRESETDEEMSRRLQNEEYARSSDEQQRNDGQKRGSNARGEAEGYYGGGPVTHGPLDQEGIHNGSQGQSRAGSGMGLRDKLRGKMGSSNRAPMYAPPMGHYGPPPGGPMYAPPMAPPYGYGMQPQPMYMQQPMRRRQGLGPGGGAALGMGGGLLGGMMLGNAMNSGQQGAYQDGFADGADFDGGDMDCGDCGE